MRTCLIALVLLASSSASAAIFDRSGNKLPDSRANSSAVAWRALTAADARSGVGVLGDWLVGDICTAFAIDIGPDDGPGHIVTNAHCNYFAHWGTDFLDPDEHRTDLDTWYHVTFNHYVSTTASERIVVPLVRLEYISEDGTDIAIFRTAWTVAELRARGIEPLPIASAASSVGDALTLIGVPLDNVAAAKMSLHTSRCSAGPNASLANGSYRAPRSVVHQCSSISGFSGGPLVDDSGHVVLLNSHGAKDETSDADCTYATRPCEILADGSLQVRLDRNYAQRVEGLDDCFDDEGTFDLGAPRCSLPGSGKADDLGSPDNSAGCQAAGGESGCLVAVMLLLALSSRRRRDARR